MGLFKDCIDEIQQSNKLGFTPFRIHTNPEGTFVTLIRVYSGRVYVLDDVATMEVSNRHIATDTIRSNLIYFVKGHVKTIIDKGGRCNASQSDVTRMATLLQTRVNSNYVLNFHNDAYTMEADMYDFHYFCVCFGIQN